MIICIVYVVLLLSMIGWLSWWWNEIWYVRPLKARCSASNAIMPLGHLGFPLLGETLSLLWHFNIVSRPDDFIAFKRRKYGYTEGIYRTHLYGSPSIIACSPSLCKFVLDSSDKFAQEWPTTQVLGTNSLITLNEGQRHGIIKSVIVKSINQPDSLSRIVLQIQPTIVAALQLWSQMPKINAFYQVKKVTLDYTMRYIAHLEFGSSHIDAIEKLFQGIVYGFRAQPWNLPGTAYHHALKCRKKITKKLKEELEKRKQKNNDSVSGESTTNDLMDSLMQMKNEEQRHLSDEEVLDNVVSTILVGHISIAYAITWSLQFLANNPHVLLKLREENKAMFKENSNESITYEDISKLKYTNKVAEETIRTANLSAFVFRKATDDIVFKGYLIPKGWSVLVWLRNLHNDPTNFKDPMSFNPDRWETRPKQGTYNPFGGGSRSCAGSALVRVSLALFLHHLSIGYKWELLNPDAKVKYLSHPLPSDGFEISICKV
ncbi:ent-kaurenoic acid oxidase 2-like isoform X1 [Chenopodium quinoa]|uniref:ent-kaurenoic acid oxidase 2-like isoform X1 n=1 Tax=Chenopodium quinoa TaxID=63459 RepID=UPI000B78E0B2|nr:ent-kaurenoic acid oxidase 2-like isoform X1 [Chenopodium quinoa]